ncbi:MFS transporter [Saccharothrix sp. S26]|uniref:MFS transporter n=1 Tax=Saccharothrix sp. S26 TaxID=2907215 RepID=UPI001F2B84C2|nr:MFS transporter [Saccharothrix sp. S26]MCE6993465.1 MFS transporter [Saccharothrix sp. S26]
MIRSRQNWAWVVAGVGFTALVGAAAFRATPGALVEPLQREFGWSTGTIGFAVSVNLMLFGLTAPFAAALMERLGVRRVVASALTLVAVGSGLTVFMTAAWQLVLFWGVLIGLGTGSMALAFVATITGRWFVKHRGLVTGILSAGSATGQLVFLPVVAAVSESSGWRTACLVVSVAALAVVPLVLLFLREHPADLGVPPYGGDEVVPVPPSTGGAARRAVTALAAAARTGPFWFLAAGFAICGATTNGLVGTHFIPAAHDHGMPTTTAAGLLALVGIFDIVGTVLSGWLTDRVDSRVLLAVYYALRGVSLLFLPQLFHDSVHPSMLVFIIFYGLDWVATVPPTVALCRQVFGVSAPVVFGWVFASHQIGAAIAATAAGIARDHFGNYASTWYAAGLLSIVAAVLSLRIKRSPALAGGAEQPTGDLTAEGARG